MRDFHHQLADYNKGGPDDGSGGISHLSEYKPDRFGSTHEQHFFAAYAGRAILTVLVGLLYLSVFLFGLIALLLLIEARFLEALGALVLAGAVFLGWTVLHNWALTHPGSVGRSQDSGED